MSDLIRQSQDANAVFSRNTDMEPADLMATPVIGSIAYSCAPNKQYALPVSTPAFNTIIEFELPKAYLSEMYVAFTLGAFTSGNYCLYPGLALIQRVELISGTETIQQFDYAPTTHMCLSRLSSAQITQILESAGGTSFASGTCIAPLPLFFTRFGNPGKIRNAEYVEPLNNRLVNGKLRLRLTLRTAAAVAAAGATVGSPTIAARLYYLTYTVPSAIQEIHMSNRESYVYRAYDFVTLSPGTSVAAGTNTTFDLKSLVGSLADLFITTTTAASISANTYYLTVDEIDFLEVFVDGQSYWRTDQQESLAFDKWLLSEVPGKASVINSPYVVPFEITRDPAMYTGALESNGITSLTITLNHSNGGATPANVTYAFGSTVNAAIYIEGDSFKRQR